jgi:hypothetical protein
MGSRRKTCARGRTHRAVAGTEEDAGRTTTMTTDEAASAGQTRANRAAKTIEASGETTADRLKALIVIAKKAASTSTTLEESKRTSKTRVMGCASASWIEARVDATSGRVYAACASESDVTRGFGAVLCGVVVRVHGGGSVGDWERVCRCDGDWRGE